MYFLIYSRIGRGAAGIWLKGSSEQYIR